MKHNEAMKIKSLPRPIQSFVTAVAVLVAVLLVDEINVWANTSGIYLPFGSYALILPLVALAAGVVTTRHLQPQLPLVSAFIAHVISVTIAFIIAVPLSTKGYVGTYNHTAIVVMALLAFLAAYWVVLDLSIRLMSRATSGKKPFSS